MVGEQTNPPGNLSEINIAEVSLTPMLVSGLQSAVMKDSAAHLCNAALIFFFLIMTFQGNSNFLPTNF